MHYLQEELERLIQCDPATFAFIRQGSLDGIWYWDLENTEEEWMSPEMWRLFGLDPAKMPHKAAAWQDIIFQEDLSVAIENFQKHCADPSHPYDQIVRYRHADGSTVWVRCRGIAIRDESGKPIRMLGAHNDLTPIKKAEEAARREAQATQDAKAELQQFAYSISHDLRSPLNTLNVLLSELEIETDPSEGSDARQILDDCASTLDRARTLVEDVMAYTALIGRAAQVEPVPLNALMGDLLSDLAADIEEADAEIDVGPMPVVEANRMQIRACLQNLLENALKYRDPARALQIRVSAEKMPGGHILSVSDTGIGIPPDREREIFEMFARLTPETEHNGLGLGLALCKRVAQNHGGDIRVRSHLGQGTTFEVHLPVQRVKSLQEVS
ncbi:MAG: PAS domain-containing sensor histidine kinase [Pseudomonadota bacterium]